MTVYNESNYLNDWLKFELDNYQSREKVTVLSGESVVMGEVMGQAAKSTPETGTADGDNTGDGTCGSVTAGDKAQIGTYTLTCTATATDGGTFSVVAPDGAALPDAEVGTAYANEQINFTISDGASDFAEGDIFTIEVSEGSGKLVPIDFAAVDGSQDAYGIMVSACDASAGDEEGVAIVRDAQVVPDYLTWPDGATEAQKASALAQLKGKGIVEREEA